VEDGGFCGGAARCGCGVFLRLPPPATTETTLGNPPRPLFSSPPQPAARLFHTAATAACLHDTRLVGDWFFQAVGKNLATSLFLSLSFSLSGTLAPFFSLCPFTAARTTSRRTAAAFLTILPPMTTRELHKPRAVFPTPSSLHRTTGDPRDVQGETNFRR